MAFVSCYLSAFTLAVLPVFAQLDLSSYIETIPNFPSEGINFKWYPSLLKSPEAFSAVIQDLKSRYSQQNLDAICALDSRGFIFGAALAYEMKLPLVMIRKKGKLPKRSFQIDYALEYGKACFEIEHDALNPKDRVIIIDDILATGGTANAAAKLVERLGAEVVEIACLIELLGLSGKQALRHQFYAVTSCEAF